MKQLKEMRKELVGLRTQKSSGGASAKLNRM
jgi:ribosomal protein L29